MTTISEKKLIRFGEDFKKLQKENKELKEKYDNLYTECEEYEDQIDLEQFNNEKLIDEIKKLKEELKLKDEIIRLHEST
jgi:uncharacterized protein YlxW (UPF0749 family)